mgnify:CR=1 FL=1
MGQAIEQGSYHLGVAKDRGPFAETEVGCDHDAGAMITGDLVTVVLLLGWHSRYDPELASKLCHFAPHKTAGSKLGRDQS